MTEVESTGPELKAKELQPITSYFIVGNKNSGERRHVLPVGDVTLEQYAKAIGENQPDVVGFSKVVKKVFIVTGQDGNSYKTTADEGERTTAWVRDRANQGDEVGFVERGKNQAPFNSYFPNKPGINRLFRDGDGWYHEAGPNDQIVDIDTQA